MSAEFWYRVSFFIAFLLVTDLLVFLGLKRLIPYKKRQNKGVRKFALGYYLLTAAYIVYAIVHFFIIRYTYADFTSYRQLFLITGIFILLYLPKGLMLVFIVVENLLLFFFQFLSFVFQNRRHYDFVRTIRKFKLFTWLGYILGWALFGYIIYSMAITRTDYRVVEQTVQFADLPASFDGMKIIQISDAHLGSFYNEDEVDRAISLINEQSPDLILFTGDMINVEAEETKGYIEKFKGLNARLGKYAVFGNHDQEDYLKVAQISVDSSNQRRLQKDLKDMGFTLLRNTHVFLHEGKDSLALIGVDSWGLKPFKEYGKLDLALQGIDNRTFQILMTHIPSHWAVEVKGRTEVNLTLSGHTHAVQLGIDAFGIKWSPIVFRYPYYWGLYQWGTQYLHVNPGMGYLGFPGRIGVRPEITLIHLKKG
jgi:predicted MPP superfamily phosphohydrolase